MFVFHETYHFNKFCSKLIKLLITFMQKKYLFVIFIHYPNLQDNVVNIELKKMVH